MVASGNKKWYALALLCVVQFMVILDVAIVNVALPSIKLDLGFSDESLQWVISAYALVFGGFLLLGGRSADLLGRRRVFFGGLIVFGLGSLLCGISWSETSLITSRAIQGLGAATISPAALSILTTTFAEGRERNIALGAWGAVGGFGAAAGVLFGGILTDLLTWNWIFLVNVPITLAALALTPFLLSESRDVRAKSFDALGAMLVTSSLVLVVLAITKGEAWGWGSAQTIGVFAGSAVLMAAFVGWERRHPEPLMPLSIFKLRTLTAANISGFILGTMLFSMFLMLTLYMQFVLGYSPLKTGVAYLAVAGTSIIWANVAAAVVNRVGVKPTLIFGMALMTVGLLYFTQVSVDGSYWSDLFPGFLIIGLGLPFAFIPITIAAVAGVRNHEQGLASGLINTTQQIGGALGIAVLATVANTTTSSDKADGVSTAAALTHGFQNAFWVGVGVAAAGVVVSVLLVRRSDLVPVAAPEAAAAEPA